MKKVRLLPIFAVTIFAIFNAFLNGSSANAQCVEIRTYTDPESGEFIVPVGVTSITVEVWGAGGRGGSRTSGSNAYGGGGGGAYSRSTLSVTPGQTINFNVGAGSSSTAAGGDTWFGSATTLMAKGGSSVPNNAASGAQGGSAALGFGEIRFSGGDGANRINASSAGGGGSSATPNGDGVDANSNTGAIAPIGGGDGGNGRSGSSGNGLPGLSPGGGGGGAVRTSGTRTGGNGGNGQIVISVCPCFTILDDGSISGRTVIQFDADCTWEAPEGLLEFEVLVVGGGGGGGGQRGGGGGGGGIVHARANVEARLVEGLPAGTTFQIRVGHGGEGAPDDEEQGEDGGSTSFDLGGIYEVIAGGGGGGGSDDDDDIDVGRSGKESSIRSATVGFIAELLIGGSGGGGTDNRLGGLGANDGGNGGRGDDDDDETSGGGGGGAGTVDLSGVIVGDNGGNGNNDIGGDGGSGLEFSELGFGTLSFSAGGGGGGDDDEGGGTGGVGGSNGAGGNGRGGSGNGFNGNTPGSGGGGGGEDGDDEGGKGARGIVFIGYANSRILPVEYISLEAEFDAEERMTELTWTTSLERENSHFEIQRSTDGLKSWEVIGNVDGMGWSDAPVDYRFEDVNPIIAGGTVYYRLNQVDFNGTSSISKVLSVKVPGVQFTEGVWRAYPNPTNGDQLRVNLLDKSQYNHEPITFRIIHPTSISGELSVNSENEMNEAISQMVGRIPKGVFVIEVKWGQKIEHIKVLKK